MVILEAGSSESNDGTILVDDDGRAVMWIEWFMDLYVEVSDVEVGRLASSKHFQACLDQSNVMVWIECLEGALTSSDAVCQEAQTRDAQ